MLCDCNIIVRGDCFTGHSELYGAEGVYEKLLSTVEKLIATECVTEFWVGNYGDFDKLSVKAVRALIRRCCKNHKIRRKDR